MYTRKMYLEDRSWTLSKLKSLRESKRDLIYNWGFDVLFPDDISELDRQIKAYQEHLVIARKRFYS